MHSDRHRPPSPVFSVAVSCALRTAMTRPMLLPSLLLAVATLVVYPPDARAATCWVTYADDASFPDPTDASAGTFRYCLDQANAIAGWDTIVLDTNWIVPDTTFTVTDDVIVQGAYNAFAPDGNHVGFLFDVVTGATLAMYDVGLLGPAGGNHRAIRVQPNAVATLEGGTITDWEAGVFFVQSGGYGAVGDVLVERNVAPNGPLAYVDGGRFDMGAGATIRDNEATVNGGAVFGISAEIYGLGVALQNNRAGQHGGALYGADTLILVEGLVATGNRAAQDGGVIYIGLGHAGVALGTLAWNDAAHGGAIEAFEATVQVLQSELVGNTAQSGAAIHAELSSYASPWPFHVSRSTFSENQSAGDGGTAAISLAGKFLLPVIENSTFHANKVDSGYGYCIRLHDRVEARLAHVTLSDCLLPGGAALQIDATSAATLENTILAGAANGDECDLAGSFVDVASIATDGTCPFTHPASQDFGTPALGLLQDNGGTTRTQAIDKTSSAFAAADPATCLAEDQRGEPRIAAECDIGAYEGN